MPKGIPLSGKRNSKPEQCEWGGDVVRQDYQEGECGHECGSCVCAKEDDGWSSNAWVCPILNAKSEGRNPTAAEKQKAAELQEGLRGGYIEIERAHLVGLVSRAKKTWKRKTAFVTIKVRPEIRERLRLSGNKTDTYSTIIARALDHYGRRKGRGR